MQRAFSWNVVVSCLALFCLFADLPVTCGQSVATDPATLESYIRLNYVKQEHMVPMRDGTKLLTAVFRPRDQSKTYPILIK